MKTLFGLLSTLLCCGAAIADDAVLELSKHLSKTPALVVVVCEGDEGDLPTIAGLVERTPWTVFCRGKGSGGLGAIRNWAGEKGLLGERVYVVDDGNASLWLADDMADAVWVTPGVDNPYSEKEILRVLHPGGVCVASGKVVVKPAQAGVDEWRHPYHGPDNNVVSQDGVARLPGELRFQTFPVFAPMPEQTLFAGGRIFFFSGHIAFHEREEALLNTLTVINAYNGLHLWSRPLKPDCVVHNVSKLATDSEVVFAEGPILWMLDAATGEQRGKFSVPPEAAAAGDTDWKWIVQEKETLWAALGPPDARVAPHRQKGQMGHWPWTVANIHYQGVTNNFGAAKTLAAFRYPEMTPLWSVRETEPFDVRALCMKRGRIFELAPENYMAARDCVTGKQLWRRTPETSKPLFDAIGGSLKRQGWGLGWSTYGCARANDDVVCIAGPSFRKTVGVSFDNGDLLWQSDVASPHPFFFNDSLYIVPRVASPGAACRRIEPLTGKVLDRFGLGVIGSCTRLTATPNQFFYRPGGGEGRTVYVDMSTLKLADYEGVVRPGCFDGVVPANGRLYINGGAPVGIVALDAHSGGHPRIVAKREAGMEMFLEPGGRPMCSGPELFSQERARTTIFKRHQGRVYFQTSGRHIALVAGRIFCARDPRALDRIVDLMNKDPKTGGKMGGGTVPRDVMQVPVDDTILWASDTADVRGLAVGTDGLVVLHRKSAEGISADGRSLWTAPLPATPVRWGVALTRKECVVTLSDGFVVCLAKESQ